MVFFFFGHHAAGASGFGLVIMQEASNPYIEVDMSMDNFETQLVLNGDTISTNNQWQGVDHTMSDEAGPSRSRGNLGKRKQREGIDEMTYSAMHEIVSHFCSHSQTGTSNEQSS